MKDLLLCALVVVKTLTLEISLCHLATTSKNCTKVRAARAARLFFLIQPIRSFFQASSSPLLSSFLKLPNSIGQNITYETNMLHTQLKYIVLAHLPFAGAYE